jgi:hypothetical protein
MLRYHREARGLTLEGVSDAIRALARANGFTPPCASFQMVGRHERGEVYPGRTYRAAYCMIYETTESDLGFRLPLPQEGARGVELDTMRRRELLQQVTVGGVAALAGRRPAKDNLNVRGITEHECAEWLAWETWLRGRNHIHSSELPAEITHRLALCRNRTGLLDTSDGPVSIGIIVRDENDNYSFSHPSLVDFFIAQSVFSDVVNGRTSRLSSVQTSHETDKIVSDFVVNNSAASGRLFEWLVGGLDPVIRVNSAGILAKISGGDAADDVINALRRDVDTRSRYITAVAKRVMGTEWDSAARFVDGLFADVHSNEMADDRRTQIVNCFAREVRNPRDVGARWSSVVVLDRLGIDGNTQASHALADALAEESSRETLRAIGRTLGGSDPI